MDAVPVIDAGGLAALLKFLNASAKHNTEVRIADLQFQPLKTLARSGLKPQDDVLGFYPSLQAALPLNSGQTDRTAGDAEQLV